MKRERLTPHTFKIEDRYWKHVERMARIRRMTASSLVATFVATCVNRHLKEAKEETDA
jgi:predicted DNA-binding ribbon-helix-helix protein